MLLTADASEFPGWMSVSIYTILILTLIIGASFINHDHEHKSGRLFIILCFTTLINVVFNIFASLTDNGEEGFKTFLRIFNFLNYSTTVFLFILYGYFILASIDKTKANNKLNLGLSLGAWAIFITDTIMCFSSIFNNIYFSFDSSAYQRGSLFTVHVVFLVTLGALLILFIILNRKALNKQMFKFLLLFPVMPFLGMFVQILVYGMPFGLSLCTLALLIISYFQKTQSMEVDYLTKTYNRRKLDDDLYKLIKNAHEDSSFSAILLDINSFKVINDTLGHTVGDQALQDAAAILKKCQTSKDDIVARYGGDEFCFITSITDKAKLKEIVANIKAETEKFNNENDNPYKLGFAMGYAVYDPYLGLDLNRFIQLIDNRMYKDKKANKNKKK